MDSENNFSISQKDLNQKVGLKQKFTSDKARRTNSIEDLVSASLISNKVPLGDKSHDDSFIKKKTNKNKPRVQECIKDKRDFKKNNDKLKLSNSCKKVKDVKTSKTGKDLQNSSCILSNAMDAKSKTNNKIKNSTCKSSSHIADEASEFAKDFYKIGDLTNDDDNTFIHFNEFEKVCKRKNKDKKKFNQNPNKSHTNPNEVPQPIDNKFRYLDNSTSHNSDRFYNKHIKPTIVNEMNFKVSLQSTYIYIFHV